MKEFIDKLISGLEEAKVSANRRNAFDSEVSYACAIDIATKLAEEYKDKSSIIDDLKAFLKEKFKYNSEQAEIWADGSDTDSYFRQQKDLYMDRADIYGEVMREIDRLSEEYKVSEMPTGWISVSERLPESENKYGWVSCIVSVIRSHYPTSSYDICDSPYDENIVMHANYNVSQKIWHLECDEQLNALIDIEDAPLNGDYVIAWQPLPAPYTEGE